MDVQVQYIQSVESRCRFLVESLIEGRITIEELRVKLGSDINIFEHPGLDGGLKAIRRLVKWKWIFRNRGYPWSEIPLAAMKATDLIPRSNVDNGIENIERAATLASLFVVDSAVGRGASPL